MCKKCENYKYFLLWVLSQQKLPKDLQRMIMETYLECYFTGNDLHEEENFSWLCLFSWGDGKWYHSIVIDPPYTDELYQAEIYERYPREIYTCIFGREGYMND